LTPEITRDARVVTCNDRLTAREPACDRNAKTEWVLLTSGTTGRPKLAVHTLSSLSRAHAFQLIGLLDDGLALAKAPVWIPATWSNCVGNRYYFVGRRQGIINIGGLKVHLEVVEAVINQHPAARMSRVTGRPNPIIGAIAVAEVVIHSSDTAPGAPFAGVKAGILDLCRNRLAAHEVPVVLREVPSLEIAVSGKLVRQYA
jgi:acyl-coenzyme A synthetase/AMP-(fatty) acid ligase